MRNWNSYRSISNNLSIVKCLSFIHASNIQPLQLLFLIFFTWDLVCISSSVSASYINKCTRHSPNLNQCISKAIEDIKPRLANGIQELHIPPMNPLILPQADLDTGKSFKATFRNLNLFGMNKFDLKHLNFDVENARVDLKVVFPAVRIIADYTIQGKLLLFQLNGAGKSDGNYSK